MWTYSVVGREDAVLRRRGEAQESSKNNERRSVHCVNASESEQKRMTKKWNTNLGIVFPTVIFVMSLRVFVMA